MALGQNIKKRREAKGWTQADLARIAGLGDNGQQAIAALENRDSKSSKLAPQIALAFGISTDELLGSPPIKQRELPAEHGNVIAWETEEEIEGEEDQAWIDRFDYHFSAGDGLIQWEVRKKRALPFQMSFFRYHGVKPENCKLLVARGDSMEPYLYDRNVFMIDSTDKRVRDGERYAIYYEDEPLVKVIFKLPGGGLRLHSYNPTYPDRDIQGDQLQYVQIVGRVIYRSG